ncbi:hypothetical protein R6Q59_012672 [Mikania micrantha]
MISGLWVVDGVFGSLRKTDENLEREKYLFFLTLIGWVVEFDGKSLVWRWRWGSSSVAELGREESHPSVEKEEWESEEWRAEEEEVEVEERRRVRTMEIRGERWRGRSWPL